MNGTAGQELRLRTVAELFLRSWMPASTTTHEPSCSAVDALERQSPFVNATLAQHALALLARLFRYGEISYHGGFINLASGATSVLRIDPQCWKRTRRLNKSHDAATAATGGRFQWQSQRRKNCWPASPNLRSKRQSKKSGKLEFKVSEKGGVSVYGLGRFPRHIVLRTMDQAPGCRRRPACLPGSKQKQPEAQDMRIGFRWVTTLRFCQPPSV